MNSHQVIRFLLVGGIAACANFISRIALNLWMPYVTAIVLAFIFGMAVAFVLNRMVVFPKSNSTLLHQVLRFVVVNLAALVQTLLISLLLARVIFPEAGFQWHEETVAHAFGIAIPVVTSYLAHKHWTFR